MVIHVHTYTHTYMYIYIYVFIVCYMPSYWHLLTRNEPRFLGLLFLCMFKSILNPQQTSLARQSLHSEHVLFFCVGCSG